MDLRDHFESKKKFKTKSKERLQIKSGSIVKTLTKIISQIFLNNDFIYIDKVQEKKKQDKIRFSCKHFFLNIKKNDIVILTKDFPKFHLYVGMKALVEEVLLHQRVEIVFLFEPTLCNPSLRNKLLKSETLLIKEKSFLLKK